jgi:oligopeptide/dipeptide ABC transporter ATP-binding protein
VTLLSVAGLVKHYRADPGPIARLFGRRPAVVRAVDGVGFDIGRGETLGLIGESGCGKSTLGRTILRLVEPTAGRVRFDGTDLMALPATALKQWRRRMQIVFQNPYASLNPRRTAADIVAQPLRLHGIARGRSAREQAAAMLDKVGLRGTQLDRYPHQFSGGQRQRIGIARALVLNPEFLVLDEPVSALDVSVQAQVIELLARLRRELSLTCLFISHDISVIGYLSDRVAVMYLGAIVESGPAAEVLTTPRHPYTQVLLSAVPRIERSTPPPPLAAGSRAEGAAQSARIRLTGEPPSPLAPPSGCHFHPRCPRATDICREQPPVLRPVSPAAQVACHHASVPL